MTRPSECPRCGSDAVLEIVYGLFDAEDFATLRDDQFAAGCCATPAKWKCSACSGYWADDGIVADDPDKLAWSDE